MKHTLDKEIIEKRKERMKLQYDELEKGVYVGGEILTFKRRVVESFSLLLPAGFRFMSDEVKNIKYPSKFAPVFVLTNEELSVDIGFNLFVDHMPKAAVAEMAQDIKEVLENNQSTFGFQDIVMLEKVDGCYFEFCQTTLDVELFHLMSFFRINHQMIQLTFNCLSELDIATWRKIVIQMLESIKKFEKKER